MVTRTIATVTTGYTLSPQRNENQLQIKSRGDDDTVETLIIQIELKAQGKNPKNAINQSILAIPDLQEE